MLVEVVEGTVVVVWAVEVDDLAGTMLLSHAKGSAGNRIPGV
jgi:hypothetical protein